MTTTSAIPGITSTLPMTSASSRNELFVLTDEQILEIAPESSNPAPVAQPLQAVRGVGAADAETAQAGLPEAIEPPPWLAAQMKDPWSGDEARELWDGVQQARQEAAAYREVFAKPEEARAVREDARALKELYPGGIEQARATAERARTLEEIDAAFYGGAGKSPEQLSAGRTALAQRMLREDPPAFREMVFAGLRALEAAGHSPDVSSATLSSGVAPNVVPPLRAVSSPSAAASEAGLKPRTTLGTTEESQLTIYRAFEKSANDELERSVGGAIHRALEQALPVAQPSLAVRGEARTGPSASSTSQTAQAGLPALQERLGGAIRADVEAALKGDRQLGEQIAQVLSARRFDDTTRAQVVRLINDRAQQLVPVAARRVIQDWTQTAFAAHRSRNEISSSGPVAQGESTRLAGSSGSATNSRAASAAISPRAAAADRAEKAAGLSPRATPRVQGRAVDYRKLSDEQILEM